MAAGSACAGGQLLDVLPRHWQADDSGSKDRGLVRVDPDTEEFRSIKKRFLSDMLSDMPPRGVMCHMKLLQVERVQVDSLYRSYYYNCLNRVCGGQWDRATMNEQWLWHGTGALDNVVSEGFKGTSYASLQWNAYGAGNYFAADAKLADFFTPKCGRKKLILARVACGTVQEKEHLDSVARRIMKAQEVLATNAATVRDLVGQTVEALLKLPEHRKAPDGAHSATDQGRGTEIIVYDDKQAYPAYVVTYELPAMLPNPYQQRPGYLKQYDDWAVTSWVLRREKTVDELRAENRALRVKLQHAQAAAEKAKRDAEEKARLENEAAEKRERELRQALLRSFPLGTAVKANYTGRWYVGEISNVNSSSATVDVIFDDGPFMHLVVVRDLERHVELLSADEAAERQKKRWLRVRGAQQWRGGRVPAWAIRVPTVDLANAARVIWASNRGGEALYEAAKAGKESEAKALIVAGANVNWKKED
eukprot:g1512.t1